MGEKARRVKLTVTFAVLVVGGYFVLSLFGNSAAIVPEEFDRARLQGALIAQKIVDLSDEAAGVLEEIRMLSEGKKFKEALARTEALVAQSTDVRTQAVLLAEEMEKMTRAVANISSFAARQAALEGISSRLSLISHLIDYSASLSQLVDVLKVRLTGSGEGSEMQSIIAHINLEVRAINDLNKKASEAMERFDKIVR